MSKSNRLGHYAQSILYAKETLEKLSKYLAVEAYFAKKDEGFINRIFQSNLAAINHIHCDANFKYVYVGLVSKD